MDYEGGIELQIHVPLIHVLLRPLELNKIKTEGLKLQIAVIGGGNCSNDVYETALEIGEMIATRGHVLLCGGRGGVMEAACKGALSAGGLTVGILPGGIEDANPYLKVIVETGLGHARNAVLVKSAKAIIALPGEYGTLSEIALALKMKRLVVSLESFDLPGVRLAHSPREALDIIEAYVG